MHHVDRATPWQEIWQAMDVLVQQAKVVYVGSANFAGWHVAEACEVARARGSFGLVSEQCKYNLLTRLVELEIQPACEPAVAAPIIGPRTLEQLDSALGALLALPGQS